jgi:glycosyltransferase involved in cell wall biosynthesis
MTLKVTFLTGEYPPMQGGIADHIAYLGQRLAPLQVASSVLISRRWQETKPVLANSPESISTVYPVIPNWGWRCWPAVSRFLTTHRPEVLHIQYQAAAFDLGGWVNWLPWYLKQRRAPVRVVTTFHDLRIPYIFPKAGALRWRSILALARYSDAVICTNREDQITLANIPQLKDKRLRVIPLGSNVEPQPPANFERNSWRARYQVGQGAFLMAYFGFLNESKGGEELVEAAALLRRQGLDAQLLLIGGDVGHADHNNIAYAKRIEGLIEQFALGPFVHRTGYVDLPEVSASLLAADAVVMPYRDGVSFRRTTLIAALRHGCPVVSTMPAKAGMIPEIQPGENMLLAPPGDATALARALTPLATQPQLQQRLAQGARQLGALFEWSRIAGETMGLYSAICIEANERG